MKLFEKYNPRDWSEVIGQTAALRQIQLLARNGLGGRAYWIAGPSGTGKTTIASLLAAEVADEFTTIAADAAGLTIKDIDDMERQASGRSLGKGGWAFLINEAHRLRKDTIGRLLNALDTGRIGRHVMWVFTTTDEGEALLFDGAIDAHPLVSRCTVLKMAPRRQLELDFAMHCRRVAASENLDGKGIDDYVRLVRLHKLNLRACLQAIEAGDMLE